VASSWGKKKKNPPNDIKKEKHLRSRQNEGGEIGGGSPSSTMWIYKESRVYY